MITKTTSRRIVKRFKEHTPSLGIVILPHADLMIDLVDELWKYIEYLENEVITMKEIINNKT